jgi:hypothetical protein
MNSTPDSEFAQTETLLRLRLAQLADHAPTAVHLPGEVPVVAGNRLVGRRGRRAGVIAAVTALIGAGGFTTYSFLGASSDGGAATPEEAVTTFVSAVEQEDVLGMIDVTLPEEVNVLRSAVDSATSEAKRIDLLGADFNASGVKGIDISADDLGLETTYLEGGLATVTATSGTVDASFDPNAFPFGEKVRALLGNSTQAGTASTTLSASDPLALLTTVERDGRWYVSVEYTVAEYVRRAAKWEVPGPLTRTPVGFDSPEAAVTGFYDRLGSFDIQGAMDTFAPGEDAMAWLAQSWMADAQATLERGRADGWSLAISGLTYETIGHGDNLTLKPITFKAEGTVPAGFNDGSSSNADPTLPTVVAARGGYAVVPPGPVPATTDGLDFSTEPPAGGSGYNFTSANPDGTIKPLVFRNAPAAAPQPFTIERANGCTTFAGGAQSMFGVSSLPLAKPVDGGYQLCGPGGLGLGILGLAGGLTELPAVSVVQTGGKWYVSPLGTVLASVTVSLHDAPDASSLFDTPLAPYLYGGMSRALLGTVVKGRQADSIDAACLRALTVENGTVTGVVADPSPDAIHACAATAGFGGSSSGSSGTVTTITVPVHTSVPAPFATIAP